MPSFLDTTNFLNVVYALNIKLEEHFAELGLNSELDRIVYAKKDFCFRERAKSNPKATSLNFPFMQYAVTNIDSNTSRNNYFSNEANISGIYLEGTGKKVRVAPIKVQYSLNFFYERFDDALYAYNRLILDNSNETILYPQLTMKDIDDNDVTFPVSAFLNYSNFNLDQDLYSSSENDWLKSNNIHVLEISGISFDTLALTTDGTENVSITDEVILEFLSTKTGYMGELGDKDTLSPQELITQYFT
ncbi:MAG: hypothetical protein PF569_08195 [Candidatus Woesearchaeota archaeon]|jgi:hypothetical protein|nr:hypothetical protein [Candidatus Woesearchaeota archaeon]